MALAVERDCGMPRNRREPSGSQGATVSRSVLEQERFGRDPAGWMREVRHRSARLGFCGRSAGILGGDHANPDRDRSSASSTGGGLPAQGLFTVGAAQQAFVPEKPYHWRGAKTHALVTTVWYPADSASVEKPQWVGPLNAPLFASVRPPRMQDRQPAGFRSSYCLTGRAARHSCWGGSAQRWRRMDT